MIEDTPRVQKRRKLCPLREVKKTSGGVCLHVNLKRRNVLLTTLANPESQNIRPYRAAPTPCLTGKIALLHVTSHCIDKPQVKQ